MSTDRFSKSLFINEELREGAQASCDRVWFAGHGSARRSLDEPVSSHTGRRSRGQLSTVCVPLQQHRSDLNEKSLVLSQW